MKNFLISLRLYLALTVLTGFAYPMLIYVYANFINPFQANGSLAYKNGQLVGSELIGQKFESKKYFWPRPSAVYYNPLSSGGSNLGPTSADLLKQVQDRKYKMEQAHDSNKPPQDLIFASGSGLDPHISLEAAQYQIARVAKERSLDSDKIAKIVYMNTESRQWSLLGEPRVNVLKLNLAIDQLQSQ